MVVVVSPITLPEPPAFDAATIAAILDALHLSKSRRIGDTALSFYRLAANNHHPEEIAP